MRNDSTTDCDYLLAGGGLQNCLIALLLLHRQPECRVTLVEQESALCGNHTWSFHLADIPPEARAALEPVLDFTWDHYTVKFPGMQRRVDCPYGSILSERLAAAVRARIEAAPNARLVLNTPIAAVDADRIVLGNGRVLYGRTVIDARGLPPHQPVKSTGYQKFVGLELRLAAPFPLRGPVLMDAEVPQEDGFRFFYVLPFESDCVLVEDTRFSDSPDLDIARLRAEVLRYAGGLGLDVHEILREESGVLPMPWSARRVWPAAPPLLAGYRGGFLHPATGYSFPLAVRLALHIADRAPEPPFDAGWAGFMRRHRAQYRFATWLNLLLFRAYPPARRYHIFQRFYTLPEDVIERFYRLEMTRWDQARFFLGRPPRGLSLRRLLEGAPES
ncbi:MAG: lycopene beta-cyclase CrtY [Candidatus Hydrogenedentes bacterium]|nr:lycopene beta-cyclase CrtY [Candidatus Hydrogenedentota bacterium]